jgi:PAS domain S-box-containing protein
MTMPYKGSARGAHGSRLGDVRAVNRGPGPQVATHHTGELTLERQRFATRTTRSRLVSASSLDPADGIFWWCGLATAADGAFAMTDDGRITLWNPAAERITGYQASEVLGRRCCDVFVARDAKGERLCPAICRSPLLNKRGEPVESFDLQVSSKGGRQIWLNMSTVVLPVTDAHGPRFIRMFRDVTAVKDVLALVRNRLAGTPADDDRLGRLTRREAEILRLMVSGATNRALADRLHVSPATIRNHTHHIFAKLGVPNRLAAVALALGQFLV